MLKNPLKLAAFNITLDQGPLDLWRQVGINIFQKISQSPPTLDSFKNTTSRKSSSVRYPSLLKSSRRNATCDYKFPKKIVPALWREKSTDLHPVIRVLNVRAGWAVGATPITETSPNRNWLLRGVVWKHFSFYISTFLISSAEKVELRNSWKWSIVLWLERKEPTSSSAVFFGVLNTTE